MEFGLWPFFWMLLSMAAFFGLALLFFLAMVYFLSRLNFRLRPGFPLRRNPYEDEEEQIWEPTPDPWDLLVRIEALERRVRELERQHLQNRE